MFPMHVSALSLQAEPAQYILNVHQQLDVWHKTLKTWCKAHKQAKEHRHRSHGSDSSSTASTACCAGTREALKKAMEKAKNSSLRMQVSVSLSLVLWYRWDSVSAKDCSTSPPPPTHVFGSLSLQKSDPGDPVSGD